jgi:hypothetical protein
MARPVLFCLMLILVSCKEISYKEPQPKGRQNMLSIPAELQGRYLGFTRTGEISKDTIVVTATGYRFGYYNPDERTSIDSKFVAGSVSDSLLIRSYRDYYFLNFRESVNTHPLWLLRIVKREQNGNIIYFSPEQEGVDFKDYIRKLSRQIQIDSFVVDDVTIYQIDPSAKQLVGLVEKGFFTPTRLKKIR